MFEEVLQTALKKREAKGKGEKERYPHLTEVGLFLPFGYYKKCFCKHSWISFCVDKCVDVGKYTVVKLLDHMVTKNSKKR